MMALASPAVARHATAWFSGRLVIAALIFIAVFVLLLVAPLIWEVMAEGASRGFEKAAPGTFFLGLGVLVVGLISGMNAIEITGGCLVGVVVLGVIVNNYLLRAVCLYGPLQRGARAPGGLLCAPGGRLEAPGARSSSSRGWSPADAESFLRRRV